LTDTLKIHKNVAWRIVDNQLFAVTVDGNLHCVESPVGVAVWQLLDQGKGRRAELVDHVLSEFDVDRPTAEADIDEFLRDLKQRGVLE
jgi:hypothetical protein